MEVLGSIGCIPMHPSFASSFTSPSSIASIFGLLYYRTVGRVCVCVGARVVTATLASGCQIDLKQSSCSTRLVVGVMVVMVVVKTSNTVVRHSCCFYYHLNLLPYTSSPPLSVTGSLTGTVLS